MFTTTSVYFIMLFLIFWAYCGYFIMLYLLSLFGKSDKINTEIINYPRISMLVPCFNEENLVKEKIENIKNLEYPKEKFKIYFLDGYSTDKTVENIMNEIKDLEYIEVVETKCRGKINQINHILSKLDSDIVVNTDMDATLEKDVLIEIVKIFESNKNIAVVGAHTIPQNCIELEAQYWADQNLLRFLESQVYSSSIVIAPCYAFRRDLTANFPDDCIADDIYISFLANSKGKKSKYIENAIVYETRTPSTLEELLTHKFRKGNAYIMELLRFLYLLPQMHPRWKLIFLTKFLQLVVMPWIIPFFVLSSISLILSGIGYMKIVIFSFLFLMSSFLVTHWLFSKKRKILIKGRYKRRSILAIFLITNFVLLINGLSYPFYKQTSNYEKIG